MLEQKWRQGDLEQAPLKSEKPLLTERLQVTSSCRYQCPYQNCPT